MIHCKKIIIAACVLFSVSLTGWSEAPVVDDSENFVVEGGRQFTDESADARPHYDDLPIEHAEFDSSQSEDGPALAKDDQERDTGSNMSSNAKLLDKILSLQQEIQELRGQLEVQAHDLKLLQQQQVSFYKDLDSRLSSGSSIKPIQSKPTLELGADPGSKSHLITGNPVNTVSKPVQPVVTRPVLAASKINPADEQISYMAAYELVKNKRYDDALNAMNIFVQKYPKGGYTANAEYWLGELYLVKKDYENAILHFDVVLHQFPSSSKTAACLLKSGYAYTAKGNQNEAKKRFQEVISNYPDTPTAQLAQSKLDAIRAL